MKTILTLLSLCACASLASAELPRALTSHAAKFEADRAALIKSAENYLKPARDRYLAVLASAEKAATAGGKQQDSVAIAAEARLVDAGTPAEEFPPDLPRTLAPHRREYMMAFSTVQKTIPAKLREIATTYLKAIAALESSALKPTDAAVLTAIATEKQRVLVLVEAAGGAQKHRNVVANSDFSEGGPGSMPPKWRAEAEVPVTDATVIADGATKFLRFRRLQPLRRANLLPEKEVTIPAKARSVAFSVRLRVKDLVPGKDYDTYPGAHITGRDARGEEAGGGWAVVKEDTGWKRFTVRFPLEPEAKTLRIAVGPFGAAGLFDVDDIEVEFK